MRPSPRPKLGQHFLVDAVYRHRIVDSLDLCADDCVVEIGPGLGAMTALLAERARQVVGIELDVRLAGQLRKQFARHPKIEILAGDFLKTRLADLCQKYHTTRCYVFGNLPYYVTSPILRHALTSFAVVRSMALLVQREVATRLVAAPGSRDYGYLTVYTQAHAEPRRVLTVPPGAFRPAPQVHSSLVRFKMRPAEQIPPPQFFEFVKRCFSHKRKLLESNLAGYYPRARVQECLAALHLPPHVRAEETPVDQLRFLFERLSQPSDIQENAKP